MSNICDGCGSVLQSDDPNKVGYIPLNKINKVNYCQRCFRLIHYGENKKSRVLKLNTIIKNINNNGNFVVFLIDFLSLNESIIKIFKRIKCQKVLVVSKYDLVSKVIKSDYILTLLRNVYDIKDNIFFVSSYQDYGVSNLINYFDYNNLKDIYFIGESNSGKSTLINKIIELLNSDSNKLATSFYENTTLDFVKVKVNNKLTIIDSPGFILDDKYNYQLNKNNVKSIIKTRVFQMKRNQVLKIDNFYLKFSDDINITLYLPNDIVIKKDYHDRLFSDSLNISNNDLVIKGLGFIYFKGICQIDILGLDLSLIEVRKSFWGGIYEQNSNNE